MLPDACHQHAICISMCSALIRQPSYWSSLCSVIETPGPVSLSSRFPGAGGLLGFPPGNAPNLHQKMHPKIMIIRLIQMIWPQCPRVKCISRFPCSHSSQTSRNRFGSSVMTPSAPCLMLQRICSSSLTVQKNRGRPAALASRMNDDPPRPKRESSRILKETLGRRRNWRE